MNKTVSVYSRVTLAITSILTALLTVLRVFLMNTYDAASGFYADDTMHMIFRYSLVALAIIMFVAAHIYIKEGKIQNPAFDGKLMGVVSVIPACAFTGFIVYMFARFVLPTMANPAGGDMIMTVFAFVAVLYYLSYGAKNKMGDARALLCAAPALVLLVLVFSLYFNASISYINQSVVLCFAAAIFQMLAIMAEANFILKRPFLCRYLSYAPTAVALSFALAIPDIIFALSEMQPPLTDIFYDIIILALGIYHFARLINLAIQKPAE